MIFRNTFSITRSISALALTCINFFTGGKKKRERYDERMCLLFEKQMRAREAMGTKYCCHPANDVAPIKLRAGAGIINLDAKRKERALK